MTYISLTEEQEIEFVCALQDRINQYKKLLADSKKLGSEGGNESYQRDIDICIEMLKKVGFEYILHEQPSTNINNYH
ncbi:hypothetical protein [Thalassotalea marina]|uniref:Uncharacterized protein n=1 Tax=Thalassotalea marina TaxID=1673741 RepID=A0A919EPW9_9GAMM|nr:hypothetical protein [Thalassotalea marina]GHG07934.1 hypothetical protein GCM10017161_42150 [Thalassotalea marina]